MHGSSRRRRDSAFSPPRALPSTKIWNFKPVLPNIKQQVRTAVISKEISNRRFLPGFKNNLIDDFQ